MKQQVTPSLILERYQQTGAHRLREAEKWLFWIKEYLEIPEDKYQLLIHSKMNMVGGNTSRWPSLVSNRPTAWPSHAGNLRTSLVGWHPSFPGLSQHFYFSVLDEALKAHQIF
jgi:hypothetical protein